MSRTPRFPGVIRVVAFALCVGATSLTASLPSFADSPQPAITEARADGGMLHILGLNLDGGVPKVTLGTLQLAVVSSAATRIDALIPATVVPGSYLLTVTLGKNKAGGNGGGDDGKYEEFWITIGAAGPAGKDGAAGPVGKDGANGRDGAAGPQGATGPMGPAGPMGPQGSQGLAGPAGKDGATGPQGPSGSQGVPGPAGPAGAAGGLPSIDALAGLACNVVDTGDLCRGVSTFAFDVTTNAISLICQPSGPRPTIRFTYNTNNIRAGQYLSVSNAVRNLGVSMISPFRQGASSGSSCPGEVLVVTVALHSSTTVQNPSSMRVDGGSCAMVTLLPDSSVDCMVTMNGDQVVRAF